MSGLVFFDDDENNDVVEEWMNNDVETLARGGIEETVVTGASKGGLGFSESAQATKQDKSKADQAKEKQKALLNKKKNNFIKRDEDDEDLHGVVLDHVEESRTTFKSKQEKKDEGNKRILDIQQQKNAKKAKKVENVASVTKGVNTESAAAAPKSITPTLATTPSAINTAITSATTQAAQAEEDRRVNSRIRKRTKTRSKQKNIRKDNRSDTVKPAYLVVKNKEYKGRPLTDRTKQILGV